MALKNQPITYVYVPLSEWLLEVSKVDAADAKNWMLGVIESIIRQERGKYDFADRLIDYSMDYRAKAAERQKAYRERKKAQGDTDTPESVEVTAEQPKIEITGALEMTNEPNVTKDTFDFFRKLYGGRKDGLETEYKRFTTACKKQKLDPAVEVTKLADAWANEDAARQAAEAQHQFFPQPKNLGTWLNNLCWQSEPEKPRVSQAVGNLSQSQRLLMQMEGDI
jgi:hypothetical protein